ncbi:MAG TPA: DUF1707 and FHA domain-containing protein [Thermoleophilaceae bacterium]
MSRASDDTREHAVGRLRSGLMSGRLGTETFVERVDAAYRAKTHAELASVTEDLPRHRARWRALLDKVAPLAHMSPPLRPPHMDSGDRRVLGRGATCDYTIADPTVSMRHAELIRTDDGWLIRDLESRNGTRVNGWLAKEERLQAGDTITLGGSAFRFCPPA